MDIIYYSPRLPRIPALTLYSGANCSLCDVAKAELAKLRQERQFQLSVVDIRAPGNERWNARYRYWIPALHIEGKEACKGRWTASDVKLALDRWEQETGEGSGKP